MTTQYERDVERREKRTRLLFDLVSSATLALEDLPGPHLDSYVRLKAALEPYDLLSLTRDVAAANQHDAERRAAAQKLEDDARAYGDLPDAPPRTRCHAEVAHSFGRATDFSQCDNAAARIVLDRENRRERVCCPSHARQVLADGHPRWGWYDEPHRLTKGTGAPYDRGNTLEPHPSWYRGKGWCMEKVEGRYCKVRVDIGSGLHAGPHK